MRRKDKGQAKAVPPALDQASKAARRAMPLILALDCLRLGARVVFVAGLALLIAEVVLGGQITLALVALPLGALLAATLLQRTSQKLVLRTESSITKGLLADIERACATQEVLEVLRLPRGAVVNGVARQPGAVARLVVSARRSRLMLLLGPLIVALAVASQSWAAAGLLLLALPAMIVAFIVLGRMTGRRARAQEAAMGRLATQFADRMRALPTILASGGMGRETAKLNDRLHDLGDRSGSVLSLAFLNSAALDLFATFSIATLAAFLCLGQLGAFSLPGFADLAGWQTLFILLLVPEFFGPFRLHAQNYHAKAEGEAAAEALSWAYLPPAPARPASNLHGAQDLVLSQGQMLGSFALPEKGLVVVTGPSGAGKTTLLRVLTGVEAPLAGRAGLAKGAGISWVAADAPLEGETLARVIQGGLSPDAQASMLRVAALLNLVGDPLLPQGLETELPQGECPLSGGQRMRAVLARALLSGRTIVADEPTAKLDAHNARVSRQALCTAASERLVIVATHDPALIAAADHHITIPTETNFDKRRAQA